MQTRPLPPKAQLTDEEIKEMAQTNPDRAMSYVVARHRARLKRRATSILRDADQAHDVCQEVFIKAMRETRFWDAEFRQGAWLYRVTNNLCLNMVRDKKRRGEILDTVPTPRVAKPMQVEEVYADERQKSVLEAMQQLSANHRQILMERFYADLSYAEIAEVLDIKLGTVMSRLSRAKRALLAVLDGDPVSDQL